jgi:hypothetical protein
MESSFRLNDPDIRNREWSPILRNPAVNPPPPPESLVETSQVLAGGPRPFSTNFSSDASKLPSKKLTQLSPVDLNLLLFLNCELPIVDQVFPKQTFGGDYDRPTEKCQQDAGTAATGYGAVPSDCIPNEDSVGCSSKAQLVSFYRCGSTCHYSGSDSDTGTCNSGSCGSNLAHKHEMTYTSTCIFNRWRIVHYLFSRASCRVLYWSSSKY